METSRLAAFLLAISAVCIVAQPAHAKDYVEIMDDDGNYQYYNLPYAPYYVETAASRDTSLKFQEYRCL